MKCRTSHMSHLSLFKSLQRQSWPHKDLFKPPAPMGLSHSYPRGGANCIPFMVRGWTLLAQAPTRPCSTPKESKK